MAPSAVIARHFLAADERDKAVFYLLEAARRADKKLAMDRAAELYRGALELLEPADDSPEASQNDVLRCRAWLGLAEGMRVVDRTDEALALIDRAQPVAERNGLLADLAAIHNLRGSLLFPRGDLDGCLHEQERACQLARRVGSPEREVKALSGLGDALYMRGRMISAFQQYDRCIHLCREHELLGMEAANLPMRGETRSYQHELREGARDCERAARIASRIGQARAEIVARLCAGQILVDLGELEKAWNELELAMAEARRLGARRFEPLAMVWLAKILAIEGARDEAEALIAETLDMCRASAFAFAGPMALGVLALTSRDADTRRRALTEAEDTLARGAVSQNYLFFYRDAMEASLADGHFDAVERFAAALDGYASEEPLPYTRFFAARGRALARTLGGETGDDIASTLADLCEEAHRVGFVIAARSLDEARDEVAG